MRSARFRAAYRLPPKHRGVVNELVATPAGLRFPSLWPGFRWVWNVGCSLACQTE